mgnify:FL=1
MPYYSYNDLKAIRVARKGASDLIEISYTASDPGIAYNTIDILTMLEEKTKQCLDSDEARLLEGILYELRMKYVMKKVD